MSDNDYLDMLRRQKLISPDFSPMEVPSPEPTQDNTLGNKYIEQVQKAPLQSDYKPSWKRRLAAVVAGGASGNYNIGKSIADEPYNRALRDYQVKTGSLGEAAKMQDTLGLHRSQIAMYTQRALAEQARAREEQQRGNLYETQATPDYNLQRYGYKPQSLDESIQLENSKHGFNRYQGLSNGLVLDRTTGRYIAGPEFERQMKDKEAKTNIERGTLDVRRGQLDAYNKRTGVIGNKNKFPSQVHIQQARKMAIDKAIAEHPEWAKFAGGTSSVAGTNTKGQKTSFKRTMETIPPQGTPANTEWYNPTTWWNKDTPPTKKDLDEYKKFQNEINKNFNSFGMSSSPSEDDNEDDNIDIEEMPEE